MPRTARITTENGYYHVITRGNRKQPVFSEAVDYERYLNLLIKYKKRYVFRLYAFCLMPNHVHILIGVNRPSCLNKIMQGLNLSYALYFNSKYGKVGHLWQDRFKSRLIENDLYLLECAKYIENNPLRSSLVPRIEQYRWNSYNFRLNSDILDNLFI